MKIKKNPFKNVKKAINKAGQKVSKGTQKIIEKSKEVGQIALLFPFRNLMEQTLKSKGLKPDRDFEKMARQFFDNVVRKNSYDEQSFFNSDKTVFQDFENYNENFDPVTISAIVAGIITYIKKLKDRKANDEPLTPTQEKVVKLSEEADQQVDDLKVKETNIALGEMVSKYWWVVVGGFVALYFFKKD